MPGIMILWLLLNLRCGVEGRKIEGDGKREGYLAKERLLTHVVVTGVAERLCGK